MDTPDMMPARKAPSRRIRRILASGWVSFLAASAGLAPSITIMHSVVEVTDGHTDLPVPLSLYSLMFLTLWGTGMAACLMAFLLQAQYRNRIPSGE